MSRRDARSPRRKRGTTAVEPGYAETSASHLGTPARQPSMDRQTSMDPSGSPTLSSPAAILPLREFWMHLLIKNCHLDPQRQVATASFFLKLAFEDERSPATIADLLIESCTTEMASKLSTGQYVHGVKFKAALQRDFPLNPGSIFLNESSKVNKGAAHEFIHQMSWLRCKDGVVSAQLVFRNTLDVDFRVGQYPFDRHVVPFRLALRVEAWMLPTARPEWALLRGGMKYPEDPFLVSEEPLISSPFVHERPLVIWQGERRKPIFCLLVARDPSPFVFGSALPICLLVLLAMVTFLVKSDDTTALRMAALLSSSVAVTTYEQAVREKMPEVSYLTYADWYFITTYVFHLAAALKLVFVLLCSQAGLLGIENGGFTSLDGEHSTPSLGDPAVWRGRRGWDPGEPALIKETLEGDPVLASLP